MTGILSHTPCRACMDPVDRMKDGNTKSDRIRVEDLNSPPTLIMARVEMIPDKGLGGMMAQAPDCLPRPLSKWLRFQQDDDLHIFSVHILGLVVNTRHVTSKRQAR